MPRVGTSGSAGALFRMLEYVPHDAASARKHAAGSGRCHGEREMHSHRHVCRCCYLPDAMCRDAPADAFVTTMRVLVHPRAMTFRGIGPASDSHPPS